MKISNQFGAHRDPTSVVVLFVNSHLEAREALPGRFPMWMILGNPAATFARAAAAKCQIDKETRARAETWEHMIYAVRLRLVRATMDTLEAEKQLGPRE
eukprot:1698213-Pyramimonas_sp.AAC.1